MLKNYKFASISSSPKSLKLYTLIIVKNKNEVLLGYKKRGFGVDRWNGFGGKVEDGESILNCAIRELREECGLTATKLFQHGVLWFENLESPDILHEVHLFTVEEYEGTIVESDEMKPKWFSTAELPFQHMWPSNAHWLPLALEGKKFDGFFVYQNEDIMLNYEIQEC